MAIRSELWVKPGPGRLIRHPLSFRPMPEEGFRMPVGVPGFYFNRMLFTGDLMVIEPPAPKPPPPPAKREEG